MLNDLMKKLFGKNGGSKEAAKRRLQFALVYDRLEVSDDILKKMQNEIVNVVTRYFVIDRNKLKLDITRNDDMSALVFNTPIISAKARQNAEKGGKHAAKAAQHSEKAGQHAAKTKQHSEKARQPKSKGKKSRKK